MVSLITMRITLCGVGKGFTKSYKTLCQIDKYPTGRPVLFFILQISTGVVHL